MALEKVSFGNCLVFALALTEVTSWTIDLPEMRKFFFEKNAKEKRYEDYQKRMEKEDDHVLYSNIEGNSKHNSKRYDEVIEYGDKKYGEYTNDDADGRYNYSEAGESGKHRSRHYEDANENIAYAREYGYQTYMERKVEGIVYNGSVYLEGLRRSLVNYTIFLEECTRLTASRNGTSQSNTTTWRPPVEVPSINSTNSTQRCREATATSEHVRRLSELAMWATRELQDLAYARKYKKGDYHKQMQEENELILKLAWFLDRLAHYTGYEPNPKDFVRENMRSTTSTTSTAAPVLAVAEDVKVAMMNCLKQNSSEAAVDRCRYPDPLPPMVQMMMEMNSNISGIPSSPSSSNQNEQVLPITSESRTNPVSEQSMELLIASAYRTPNSNLYPNFAPLHVRNVQKRSVSSMDEMKKTEYAPKHKRSIEDDPVIHFVKYYAKNKVWEGANPNNLKTQSNFQEYEIKNHISTHIIKKRAMNKQLKYRVPEDPFQDLSKYIKHKPGVNYIKDEDQAKKIKEALEKIENSKPITSKYLLRQFTKKYRQKRSIKFEKDVDLPRESVDPQGDISYYIKNKQGTNYNNDLLQAVQVRAGLEQIFNNPNIEVVRRYGSNYNPLNPAPFYAGLVQTQSDF